MNLFSKRLTSCKRKCIHGEDGGHSIQRGNKNSYFTDPNSQQQSPGGLTVCLPMTEDLRTTDPKDGGQHERKLRRYFQDENAKGTGNFLKKLRKDEH